MLHPDYERYHGPKTKAPTLKNVQTLVRASKGDISVALPSRMKSLKIVFARSLYQGYLEPYAITVEVDQQGRLAIWVANRRFSNCASFG